MINKEQSVKPKYKLIGCEIFYRELCFCAALSDNIVDLSFLPKGLHNDGQEVMSRKIQEEIDQVETSNQVGATLNIQGADYGLRRGNLDDDDFRMLIDAFIGRFALGNGLG